MNIKKDQNGFSLLEAVIASAIMLTVTMAMLKTTRIAIAAQKNSEATIDRIDFKAKVKELVSSEKICSVSLAGDSADTTFRKSDIDNFQEDEGLEFEFFNSNQEGSARTEKLLSGSDSSFNKFGKLTIKSIKLFMNVDILGDDYSPNENHRDQGIVRTTITKKIFGQKDQESNIDIPIYVTMSTDIFGRSTIKSCSDSSSEIEEKLEMGVANFEITYLDTSGDDESCDLRNRITLKDGRICETVWESRHYNKGMTQERCKNEALAALNTGDFGIQCMQGILISGLNTVNNNGNFATHIIYYTEQGQI